MKRFLLSILCCLLAVVSGYAEETVTYTVSSYSAVTVNGNAPEGSSATFKNTYTSNKVQLTKGNSMTLTLSGYAGNKITGITMSMKSNKSAGAGNFSATVGTTEISSISTANFDTNSWAGKYSQDYVYVTPEVTATEVGTGENVVLKIAATVNSLYCQSFTITYESVPTGDTPEVAKPTIEGETTFIESTEVKVNVAAGTTAYYTLDGSTPTNESTKYTGPLTIKADATLKVIAYDENGNESPIVSQDFTQEFTATLVEDVDDLKLGSQVVVVASDSNYALSTLQNKNNRGQIEVTKDGKDIKLNDNVQILTLEAGTEAETFAFNTGSGYLYAASSGDNWLRTQDTKNANSSWSIDIATDGVATVKAKGSYTRNMLQHNQTNGLFSCYASDKPQKPISLYKVNLATVEDYVLNVLSAGWATLYLGYDVTIPEDVTCFVISEVTAESAILTKVEGVLPANTGVIVEATKGEYTFEVAGTADDVESILTGTIKNEYVKAAGYVLGIVDGNVGLYMAEMAGGVFLNNANKAYLPASEVPTAQGTKALKFRFDDQTTGINGVATGKKPEVIFDLYGRKVNNATAPGLYIINGKKVMVK